MSLKTLLQMHCEGGMTRNCCLRKSKQSWSTCMHRLVHCCTIFHLRSSSWTINYARWLDQDLTFISSCCWSCAQWCKELLSELTMSLTVIWNVGWRACSELNNNRINKQSPWKWKWRSTDWRPCPTCWPRTEAERREDWTGLGKFKYLISKLDEWGTLWKFSRINSGDIWIY